MEATFTPRPEDAPPTEADTYEVAEEDEPAADEDDEEEED